MRKLFITVLLICITASYSAASALLYKNYIVRYDKGKDILCDPYVVQKGDWVFKIFRQKGEISHKDFPEFLAIFKRLNPSLRNIDRIRPGQHILIPLKKLKKNSLPDQASGVVTIPFVTISNLPDIIKPFSKEHIVRKGEFISRLILKVYGSSVKKSYREGLALFRLINPDIVNLNHIYAGQKIYIPDSSLRNKPWYNSLFDSYGNIKIKPDLKISEPFITEKPLETNYTSFDAVASILDATLLNKGTYYFPGKVDYNLDLSSFPLIELKDGTKFLLTTSTNKKMNASGFNAVKSYWNKIKIIPSDNEASIDQTVDLIMKSIGKKAFKNKILFSDNGVKMEIQGKWIIDQTCSDGGEKTYLCITPVKNSDEKTPDSIVRYLEQNNIIIKDFLKDIKDPKQEPLAAQNENSAKDAVVIDFSDHKAIVNTLLTAMDYNYTQNVVITFPYAGIQIKALSNLISISNGKSVLIDFEDLYGDAVAVIKKTGFEIIQIKKKDPAHEIIENILNTLEISYEKAPTFMTSKRADVHNTSLTVPGYLISNKKNHKTLIATVPVNDDVVQFLTNQDIRVIMSR